MGTVYTARAIELDSGEYGFTLDIDDVHVLLSVAGGVGYTVTAPEHPGWSKRGLLKTRKHRNSSREDGFAATVISIPSPTSRRRIRSRMASKRPFRKTDYANSTL